MTDRDLSAAEQQELHLRVGRSRLDALKRMPAPRRDPSAPPRAPIAPQRPPLEAPPPRPRAPTPDQMERVQYRTVDIDPRDWTDHRLMRLEMRIEKAKYAMVLMGMVLFGAAALSFVNFVMIVRGI